MAPFRRPWMEQNGAASAASGSQSFKAVVAGTITGAIEICITYPTEYVKTQLQLDENTTKAGGKRQYAGIVDCVKKTIETRGFFGLYRGLSVLLLGTIPKSGIRFGVFEELKARAVDKDGNFSGGKKLLCGLGAGVVEATIVCTPMETIKVKFINDQRSTIPRFKGLFHGVATIVKENGFRGIYQGVIPTVVRQGSNQAIRFYVLETCKDMYRDGASNKQVPKLLIGVFGASAGAASVLCNAPVDVVKTRMQGLDAGKYKGTWDCVVQIWKHEGGAAFYKGAVPRLSRVCLDVAITFMVYDSIMEIFKEIWL